MTEGQTENWHENKIDQQLLGQFPKGELIKVDMIDKNTDSPYTSLEFRANDTTERYILSDACLLLLVRYAASKAIKVGALNGNHQ